MCDLMDILRQQAVRNQSHAYYEAQKVLDGNYDPLANMFTMPVDGKEVDIRYMTKADWAKIGINR